MRTFLHDALRESFHVTLKKTFFIFICFADRLYKKPTVVCRVACLGEELLGNYKRFSSIKYVNFQKARIDFLLDHENQLHLHQPQALSLQRGNFGERLYEWIQKIYKVNFWSEIEKSRILIIDTFSELTDSKILLKSGLPFFCHNSDLDVLLSKEIEIDRNGLYDLKSLKNDYEELITRVSSNTAIVFVHYSARLDHREFFQQRAKHIEKVLIEIRQDRKNVSLIKLDDSDYNARESDDFPYHYGKSTMLKLDKEFTKALQYTGVRKSIVHR